MRRTQVDHVPLPVEPMVVEPVTLEGRSVRLEPLSLGHVPDLIAVGLDEAIWRWMSPPVQSPEELRVYVENALRAQQTGSVVPFATIWRDSGRAIGSTRYLSIDRANYRLEIGATWLGRAWQRTVVNTEAKYLLLRHAFETLDCIRVEFKTDSFNTPSRNALLRIGAKQEGIFRNHIIYTSGRLRHSVYFSITDEEWPTVKADLENKLGSHVY